MLQTAISTFVALLQNAKYDLQRLIYCAEVVGRAKGIEYEASLELSLGRISWLRRVRLENPLGHGNFLSGLKLSGERDGGLGLARFSAVCPLGGHMYANGL